MKKNEERILKYLSDLMSDSERNQFEKELALSEDLKNELNDVNSGINSLRFTEPPEADERYFAGILPRVREKLAKEKKRAFRKYAFYFAPSAAAILIFSLILFGPENEIVPQYRELAMEVINNISDKEVSENYFTQLESNPADIYFQKNSDELNLEIPDGLEIKNDSYIRLLDSPAANEYSTLSRLSDSDLEIVYEKLSSATSQKVLK
ncbi:MAG: hypothetical protein CVV24_10610 [Ignavibacteriae bacterium HGW-Ignavibacteriae-3]|nr:MAG: hypothetical protein CVV24_10610 [Ignavibacteriae bacterium HGW-Ignavibacteriae-3]